MVKRDNGQGMFTMDQITAISNMSLADGKAAAYAIVKASTANEQNKLKATTMIDKAFSLKGLLLGMSNFSLAHQGLSVR
jgi:2-phospho-L-lactate transferase/gluconeogenesis factor (CofD/UPF0052 family)